MKFTSPSIALTAFLALVACDDENATILSGTQVEKGAPGEFFVPGRAKTVMRCVFDLERMSGRMIDYPVVEGGEIRARDGWKATFTGVDYNRVRVFVVDRNGAVNPGLSEQMRGWLDQCAWP